MRVQQKEQLDLGNNEIIPLNSIHLSIHEFKEMMMKQTILI